MKDDYVYPRGNAPGMELRDWFAGMAMQANFMKASEEFLQMCRDTDDWEGIA